MTATVSIEQLSINTIRTLSIDAVQAANSGHPGTPMALAPVAYVLWNRIMKYDPAHPRWPARDRFVLSCGHASMLLYSMLHLADVKALDENGEPSAQPSITIDDIRNFRKLHSPCAGHPEYGEAEGIETTTGPLGQGVANSVGMALAAKWLSARYDGSICGFNTFALCSDGDIMEGVGCEAASLAGHLKLSNLCWIYDDNRITIEGRTDLAFSENVGQRFEGLGWRVLHVEDANDVDALETALRTFETTEDRPTLIIVRSIIGFGSPNKADTHGAHGAALGEEEVQLTKQAYGWPYEKFHVPEEVRKHFQEQLGTRGAEAFAAWESRWTEYRSNHVEPAQQLECMWRRELPDGWDKDLPEFPTDAKGLASRVTSGKLLNAIAPNLPWLIGGSADLSPSNMTDLDGEDGLGPDNYGGRILHFGVREHSMAAICNGMSLVGLRPYGGTFFVFTDYMRPSMRLSCLANQPVLYILTHDSIGLGEDGPTHQPVEHLAACRAMPGLLVMRPGDANEVVEAYRSLLTRKDQPTALVLTRQGLPTIDRGEFAPASGAAKGGYTLADPPDGEPEVILIGTGSELGVCLDAYRQLTAEGLKARVVSMPCCELFDEQEAAYRNEVLPPHITARVAAEAGVRLGWDKYIGVDGRFVGMTGFGASAPYQTLYEHFGITAARIIQEAKAALA